MIHLGLTLEIWIIPFITRMECLVMAYAFYKRCEKINASYLHTTKCESLSWWLSAVDLHILTPICLYSLDNNYLTQTFSHQVNSDTYQLNTCLEKGNLIFFLYHLLLSHTLRMLPTIDWTTYTTLHLDPGTWLLSRTRIGCILEFHHTFPKSSFPVSRKELQNIH